MKKKRRDDFSRSVQEDLARQVGFVCSNPECRAATLGPASDDKASSTGVAAHICAAAIGGPRYCAEQTAEERSSQSNGRWVCHSCSRLIDNDPLAFNKELLRRWKVQAVQAAAKQHGSRVLTDKDVQEQMVSVLSALPTSMSLKALSNTHAAVELLLEQLDPRLQFKVTHGPTGSRYQIFAKETVHLQMKVVPEDLAKAQADWSAFIENGRKTVFKVKSLAFDGSKAMERVLSTCGPGMLAILPEGMKLTLRLVATKSPKKQLAIGDALLTQGTKRYELTSALFNGLMPVSIRGMLLSPSDEKPQLTMDVNYSKWQGVDLRLLSEFDSVLEFFEALSSSKDMTLEFHKDGKCVSEIVNIQKLQEYVAFHLKWLHYVEMGRRLCQHYGLSIPYSTEHVVSHAEYQHLSETLEIVEGRQNSKRAKVKPIQLTVNLTTPLHISPEGLLLRLDGNIQNEESAVCRLFDYEIEMPPLRAEVEGRGYVDVPGHYKSKDVAKFTLPMEQGSKLRVFYEDPMSDLLVRKACDESAPPVQYLD